MSICYGTINDFQVAISCIKELEKIFTRKELPDVFYVMYFTLCFTTFRAHLRHDSARSPPFECRAKFSALRRNENMTCHTMIKR